MEIFILIVIGIAGGVLGGLGMGGGTLLIPLLVLFGGLGQHSAQALSLIAFIPMAVIALFIHAKNKLIKFRYLLTVSLPAAAAAVAAAFLAKNLPGEILTRSFGVFLAVLGLWQFISLIVKCANEHKKVSGGRKKAP